jgi:uncharacterized protein with GYD domain
VNTYYTESVDGTSFSHVFFAIYTRDIRYKERKFTMAIYMAQFTYTSEAWAAMIEDPQDHTLPSRKLVQQLGGKLLGLYYAWGEYDGIALFEMPDDICASAVNLATKAAGDMKIDKITRLFTMEEALEAMRKAKIDTYSVPTR